MEATFLMLKLTAIIILIFLSLCLPLTAPAEMKPGEFLVLCYHAVPEQAQPGDSYSVPQKIFAEQMEYLRTHGYHVVSLDDILDAGKGGKELPENPVLLTFDDAYISYYDFIVPFLEKLNYPSVLAVVGAFIDHPEPGLSEPLMSWAQIREVSSRKLVRVVSHTYNLHRSVQYNPQGNVAAAVSVRAFDPVTKIYETEKEYKSRINADFLRQNQIFLEKLEVIPQVLVWPYGEYNSVSLEIARENGYRATFTLKDGFAHIKRLNAINRNTVENTPMDNFISMVNKPDLDRPQMRAIQVDLDLIYDDSSEQTDINLGKLIDRLVAMRVNTVFLQAFADPEGTGNIESVYFHNRVLPVRADIFSHAVHQMRIRGMMVYAWMPVLSLELPDKELNESLKVRAISDGKVVPSTSWYRRLTPFSDKGAYIVRSLYEDLAAHAQIRGILFQDDAYLSDTEDFNSMAIEKYKDRFGRGTAVENLGKDPVTAKQWVRYKTDTLMDYTYSLAEGARKFRPGILLARNLYSAVLENREAEAWFAQNYELFLKNYDYTVVMAYPQMERIKKPSLWLKKLAGIAKGYPDGIEKTVFKLQAYDWRREVWIKEDDLLEEFRDILSSGGKHIAYYPDNFQQDKPALMKIRLEMSTKTYPYLP